MTTETPSVIGIVLEREHKDGTTNGKHWDRYSFQIAGGDGKHYYSSFDQKAWDELEKDGTYQVFYALRENPKGGQPSRDIQWWKEAQLDGPTQQQVQEVVKTSNKLDTQIMWNSSVNNAVQLYCHSEGSILVAAGMEDCMEDIREIACNIYELITSGPPQAEPQPDWQDPRDAPQATESDTTLSDSMVRSALGFRAPERTETPVEQSHPSGGPDAPNIPTDSPHCLIAGHMMAELRPITGMDRRGHPFQGQICYG